MNTVPWKLGHFLFSDEGYERTCSVGSANKSRPQSHNHTSSCILSEYELMDTVWELSNPAKFLSLSGPKLLSYGLFFILLHHLYILWTPFDHFFFAPSPTISSISSPKWSHLIQSSAKKIQSTVSFLTNQKRLPKFVWIKSNTGPQWELKSEAYPRLGPITTLCYVSVLPYSSFNFPFLHTIFKLLFIFLCHPYFFFIFIYCCCSFLLFSCFSSLLSLSLMPHIFPLLLHSFIISICDMTYTSVRVERLHHNWFKQEYTFAQRIAIATNCWHLKVFIAVNW